MGYLSKALTIQDNASFPSFAIPGFTSSRAALANMNYSTLAREGYGGNEIVFAAIEMRATSAAEPKPQVRTKNNPEWQHDHQMIRLLERPNPFMDRFEFFATVILHRDIAGNAFGYIQRDQRDRPAALWMMRPDLVRVVPDSRNFISHYEYSSGTGDPVRLEVRDVIHWKARNPHDSFYGMPPMAAASGRIDVDNYMRGFVKSYFERAGVPSAMLNVRARMDPTLRKEVERRFNNEFRQGGDGWQGLFVVDNTEATFTPLTTNLGPAGMVVPDLDRIDVQRIATIYGVPPALLGLDETHTSYASLKMVQTFFWDNTLSPLYKELMGPLNLRLTPNYPDLDEASWDFSEVRALQEDIDAVHARLRSDYMAGGITFEEYRVGMGLIETPANGTLLVPSNMVPISVGSFTTEAATPMADRRPALPAPSGGQ